MATERNKIVLTLQRLNPLGSNILDSLPSNSKGLKTNEFLLDFYYQWHHSANSR